LAFGQAPPGYKTADKKKLETAILGQILAWSVLELDFGIWVGSTWLLSC
jgi:hypothetical protein